MREAGIVALGFFIGELFVEGDFAMGAEEHLPEVAEDGSFAGGEAVFREGQKDFGEDAADVFGCAERGGGLGEFGGEGGGDDDVVFGVREAVGRIRGGGHEATVSGGGQIGATRGTGLLGQTIGAGAFHSGTPSIGGEVWHPGCFCEACEKKGFAAARVRKCVKRQDLKRAKYEERKRNFAAGISCAQEGMWRVFIRHGSTLITKCQTIFKGTSIEGGPRRGREWREERKAKFEK